MLKLSRHITLHLRTKFPKASLHASVPQISQHQTSSLGFHKNIITATIALGNERCRSFSTMRNEKKGSAPEENGSTTSDAQHRTYLPKPGQSTGDATLDNAIRKWRQTNTPQDERFQKIFRKSESGLVKSLLERKDDPLQDYSVQPQQQKETTDGRSSENKETGEINGPKGPEPTRYGDWERNGRTFDF